MNICKKTQIVSIHLSHSAFNASARPTIRAKSIYLNNIYIKEDTSPGRVPFKNKALKTLTQTVGCPHQHLIFLCQFLFFVEVFLTFKFR